MLILKWEKVDSMLSDCEIFRRHISHGISSSKIPDPYVLGVVKKGKGENIKFEISKITLELVEHFLNKIREVQTGKAGFGNLREDIEKAGLYIN